MSNDDRFVSNDLVLLSEGLIDRLPDNIFLEPAAISAAQALDTGLVDDALDINFVVVINDRKIGLEMIGWDKLSSNVGNTFSSGYDSITAIVPEFFLMTIATANDFTVLFFGEEKKVISTAAKRDSGFWEVTFFLEDE